MTIYQLAEKFQEPDVDKIAELPAKTINHWIAYFNLSTPDNSKNNILEQIDNKSNSPIDRQCIDVMRAIS